MRGLTDDFMNDLKTGNLSVLLQQVIKDDTLCLAIRENYTKVYYRGCNLLCIRVNGQGYKYKFDENYLKNQPPQYISVTQLQGLRSLEFKRIWASIFGMNRRNWKAS